MTYARSRGYALPPARIRSVLKRLSRALCKGCEQPHAPSLFGTTFMDDRGGA
jgi:hypothetical protein